MAMTENFDSLSEKAKDYHRAIEALREEVEATDLYLQRAEKTKSEELKVIFLHNAKEEKEHAAMLLEWLRKQDKELENELKEYLFKDGEVETTHE